MAKTQSVILLFGVMLVFLLTSVSAELQYWQEKYEYPTLTKIHSVLVYDADNSNFVTGGNPLEVYVWYDIYIDSWNELNPEFPVDFCNFTIQQYPQTSSNATFNYTKEFTDDNRDAKYFLRMVDGDTAFVDIDCHFNSTNTSILIPANFQIVTPTWECKACQYYEWSLIERDIIKAEEVGDNLVNVVDNIYNIVFLNFEIWLALFWIILIIVAVHSTGLLFIGLVWLFAYLKGVIS